MATVLFYVHIAASIGIGFDAYCRGRNPYVWTLLTLIPYGIFVTWPLLYILPNRKPAIDKARAAIAKAGGTS